MLKFYLFSMKKLYFNLIFNSISRNCDPLFLQIDFDHTHFAGFCPGGFCPGGCPGAFCLGFMSRGVCPGIYVR